ncbi:MAG: LytR/AlgR family response regulator transcription factor [Pseudobacter sp.]|uniref:LytR/AlgR family response regulator transcription factor n=1 Tax=Pseudobacter sp. TaxID=2045420 RepID=UPI003F7EDDB0
MEKFNCLIIEDEPLAAEVLQDYISQIPFLECQHSCRDGIYAMHILQKEKIDVIFLDIHLPKIKGLDFLRTLKNPPQVIVTTAYRDYAIDGYELNVVDYLLKPIHFNRFLTAVNKLRNHVQPQPIATPAALPALSDQAHLLINVNKKKIKVYLKDILYIESKKEYISIVTADQSFITKFSLTEMEAQLQKDKFLRIHRSFIVGMEKIKAFTSVSVEINGKTLPIGRSYRELVQQLLSEG